jgi:N-acyl-D-amino-acid deacylase
MSVARDIPPADGHPRHVDLILVGGTVFDGFGAEGVLADVAVVGDRVVAVGARIAAQLTATRTLDVTGLAVAPGFIDPHTHSDVVPLMKDPQPFKLFQGVTTEIVGNCGNSAAPLVDERTVEFHRPISSTVAAGVQSRPRTFAGYLDEIEAAGPTNHVASLVGHHTLRMSANGMDVPLGDGAQDLMDELADAAFADGAFGLSSGLIYAPGSYAHNDEITRLARVAYRWQRPYATHMRDEGNQLELSLKETLDVARHSGVRVQVSHAKAAGTANHGKSALLLDMLRAARLEGIDVLADQYPYTTGESFISSLLPAVVQEGGRDAMVERLRDPGQRLRWKARAEEGFSGTVGSGSWHQTTAAGVMISMHKNDELRGSTIADVAVARDIPHWDALCDVIVEDPASMMVYQLMAESDVRTILADPLVAIGSDNSVPVGFAHQRGWGCFPTVLGTYTRDLGVLSLPEAIRKMTSLPARQFGLTGRGYLGVGAIADIAVFDPATVGHAGSPRNPSVQPTGIPVVVLAGRVVVEGGIFSGERLGRVLRAGHAEPATTDRANA